MDPPSLARSLHCFRATDNRPKNQNQQPARSRAKFTPEEREKVHKVRQQGACLRCRMLRIRCSNDNPCKSCLESAIRGSERKVLSFCYCIRSRYADVNIFYSDQVAATDTMKIENITAKMSGLLARVALPASFTSGFDLLEQKDKFNDTLESWLTGDPSSKFPNGSIVALCCSNLLSIHFQEELLDDDLLPEFQKFLLATTLAHSGWTARDMKKRELCAAGHISGYRLITRLDRILTPQFLSQCSPEYCQVLFLLLLGTILGVGYSSSQLTESESSSRQFPPSPTAAADMLDTEFQQSPTLWLAMKEHLCQMLAHHLIFLASMLGIKLDTGVERRIIDTAIQRWSKMESFVWADGVENADHGRDRAREMARRRAEFTASQIPPYATTEPTHSPQKQAQILYDHNPPYWQQSSTAQPPQDGMIQGKQPPLVPISCPEITQFQTSFPQWSENPASYLNMEMDEESPPSLVPPPPPQPTSQGQGPDDVAMSPFETAESRSAPSLESVHVYAEPEMVIQTPPMQTQTAGDIDWNIMDTSNTYNAGTGTGNNARPIQPRPGQVVRSQTEPIPQSRVEYSVPWRRIKRRSMWVVRTFDGGPEQGQINVQARLRGREVPRDFGLFV